MSLVKILQPLKQIRFSFKELILLSFGGVLLAFNVNVFIAPSKIAPGGVSGISIIINDFTNWPIGLMMFIMNIPLLFIGFKKLGRFNFLFRTLYVLIIYSAGVDFLASRLGGFTLTDDLMLNALYGGVLGGIGTGLVYLGRGTSGSTGIIGRVLQLKTGIPVSQIYILTDGFVLIAAGLVFGWERALYALLTIFVWGVAADYILEGPSVVRTVFIVTDCPEKVADEIIQQLNLGVTSWPVMGMYTERKHSVLFCTISRPDINGLREVVLGIDPDAFLVIGHGHQARGGILGRITPKK